MGFKMISNLILMGVLVGMVIVEKDKVTGRTIQARSAGPKIREARLSGRMNRLDFARRSHQDIEKRATLPSGLQPLFLVNATNTVYGGYSSKPLQLADRKSSSGLQISVGSFEFYTKDLNSYLQDRLTPNHYGIYGFAASFNTPQRSSDYSFFKSIANDRNSLSAKGLISAKESHSHKSRSLQLSHLIRKRQDDQVQCRNQKGASFLFSKDACSLAAAKMVSEKTAMSSCGNCQLVMIGPAGQLSSSNMPARDLQTHVSNILTGCGMGQRIGSSNIVTNSFSHSIPDNAKPNYVLLLVQGLGDSCNEYKK